MDQKNEFSRRGFLFTAGAVASGPLLIGLTNKAAAAGPIAAGLTVEPEPLHALPLTQYGHFIEHLGKCVKGGIWAEGESEDMFLGGVRWELVEAMRSINPPLIRYPGGCFADGYHWRDGIGPRSSRPRRRNRAWGHLGPLVGPTDDNHFGTDEFLQLCEELGTESMLTANVGSGSPEEAADWVEYVNGSKDTKWGSERARNGHPEPYGVKYWFIGNEIFGWHEIGYQTPEEYVHTFIRYARAMRAVDPDLKLIAVGGHMPMGDGEGPNRVVLRGAGDEIDYLSVHQYVPSQINPTQVLRYQFGGLQKTSMESVYYDVLGSIEHMRRFVEHNCKQSRSFSPSGKPVPIIFDEWNLWFNFVEDVIHANYNLRDGLWVATMFNLFHRHAPDLPIANVAQMVNCLGIISSDRRGTFLTPSALAFKLYTERAGEELLPSSLDCPPIPHASGISVLDVSATRSAGKVSLFLVNRHYHEEVVLSCRIKGVRVEPDARRFEIAHSNPAQYNTAKEPAAVGLVPSDEDLKVESEGADSLFSVRLQPHSIICLELIAAKA